MPSGVVLGAGGSEVTNSSGAPEAYFCLCFRITCNQMGSFEGLSKLIVKHTKHFLDQVNIELSSGHKVTKILHISGGYK